MKHSQKTSAQLIVSACEAYKIQHVVLSPGSRNAPLIIEFNASENIKKYSVVDERSAAFFALGMALESQEPVAIVCSSGSALLNYYPAIAEAYYSGIPLVIISADRPKRLIDIGDGQTIRQENVYQNHIVSSANLSELNLDENYRAIAQVFSDLLALNGPVHINVPFDEPLYETVNSRSITFTRSSKKSDSLLTEEPIPLETLTKYASIWNRAKRKMLLVGVAQPDEMLQIQLTHLTKDPSVIILTENTSNLSHPQFIDSIDQVVFPLHDEDFAALKPDILLTFGGMLVSKKIKQLLRNNPPKQHWHIDAHRAPDTFHCLSKHFEVSPTLFFSQFFFLSKKKKSNYQEVFLKVKEARNQKHNLFMDKVFFSDLKVINRINKAIPQNSNLQFSNSTPIRYAQLFTWHHTIKIGCNRGTSGIDGSVSTALGVATISDKSTLLITGDLSFFYDSNALWNRYIPASFRIILINNGGGGIFRFIPGPTTTETLEYFETPHYLTAKQLCNMHGIDYITACNEKDLDTQIATFFNKSTQAKLLEVFTPKDQNAVILKSYFSML